MPGLGLGLLSRSGRHPRPVLLDTADRRAGAPLCACCAGARAPSQPKRRGRQDSTGLGNGITFALDPELCPNLLPTFKEESQASVAGRLSSFGVTFVDCQEVLE